MGIQTILRGIYVQYCRLHNRWHRHVELRGAWDSVYGLNFRWQADRRGHGEITRSPSD